MLEEISLEISNYWTSNDFLTETNKNCGTLVAFDVVEDNITEINTNIDLGELESRNSYMLIHQLSTAFWGKYSEFEDEKQNLDLMMQTIKRVYKEYTKVPMGKLDEILKHDLLWDAETCKSLGLIDEII